MNCILCWPFALFYHILLAGLWFLNEKQKCSLCKKNSFDFLYCHISSLKFPFFTEKDLTSLQKNPVVLMSKDNDLSDDSKGNG